MELGADAELQTALEALERSAPSSTELPAEEWLGLAVLLWMHAPLEIARQAHQIARGHCRQLRSLVDSQLCEVTEWLGG